MPPERCNASVFSGDCTKSDGLPGFSVLLLPKPQAARVDMARERAEAVELADLMAGELDQLRAEQKAAQMLLTEKDEEISHWRGEAALMREKAALLEGKVAGLEQALNRIGPQMIPVVGTIGD